MGSAIRHSKFCGSWWFLLSQHGGGWNLHGWRCLLGVWGAGLGPHRNVCIVWCVVYVIGFKNECYAAHFWKSCNYRLRHLRQLWRCPNIFEAQRKIQKASNSQQIPPNPPDLDRHIDTYVTFVVRNTVLIRNIFLAIVTDSIHFVGYIGGT